MIASYEELRRNLWDICREIISFKNCLEKKAIPYSSHLPWVRLWEYSKAIAETGVSRGDVVLDAGGASTVFSYYLGKIGAICHTLDINEKLVKASVRANKRLGFYLFNSVQSITNLAYRDETFDYVFCICVLEHIHYSEQEKAIRELSRVLKKGGFLVLTLDLGWKCKDYPFFSFQDIIRRIIIPSGLELVGNQKFTANYSQQVYSSPSYAIVSVFLRKTGKVKNNEYYKVILEQNKIRLNDLKDYNNLLNIIISLLPPFLKFKVRIMLINFFTKKFFFNRF